MNITNLPAPLFPPFLVSAFAAERPKSIRDGYRKGLRRDSYGDAMLILAVKKD
jgi:hypothetical protein